MNSGAKAMQMIVFVKATAESETGTKPSIADAADARRLLPIVFKPLAILDKSERSRDIIGVDCGCLRSQG